MRTDVGRATMAALDPLLADAPELARRLPPGWPDAIRRYVELLLKANRHINLTRVVEPDAVARDHLLDALAALPFLDGARTRRVIDLGSGGGVPAIPLALARPDLTWTLVDSVGKKADALRGFVTRLGLANVTVVAERLETLAHDPEHRESHDLATARACAPLPVLVELALPLLRVGGGLLAWKGSLAPGDAELRSGAAAAGLVGGGRPQVRSTGLAVLGGRTLVEVRKLRATPARFPRRPGVPGRRPLA
ncbi:MAG: 16S rRNA (guanine(527)-N(7))-methyltransferase RsmG [Chloroflexota bacterium]